MLRAGMEIKTCWKNADLKRMTTTKYINKTQLAVVLYGFFLIQRLSFAIYPPSNMTNKCRSHVVRIPRKYDHENPHALDRKLLIKIKAGSLTRRIFSNVLQSYHKSF